MTWRPRFFELRARLLLLPCLLVLAVTLFPVRASARDYGIDRVDIDATVSSDGSLSVNEMREFNFDGLYHGVYWKIPTGSYDGRAIATSIGAVGELVDGKFVPFVESDSARNGTYTISEYSDYIEVKLYSEHEDETARFVINYTDRLLASSYPDTAELYWKFVSDGWDVESKNITCRIHLPVPSTATVSPGENVRAWGHGPLDASVSFDGSDLVFFCPGVGGSEFAEARIVFPKEWVPNAVPSSSSSLGEILSQEQRWADEANQRRTIARSVGYGVFGLGILSSVGTFLLGLRKYRGYKESHTPQFKDKYFRDVPTDDHPAVLGALLNDGKPAGTDLTASLMRLTDMKLISLELVKSKTKGFLGMEKVKDDYRITRTPTMGPLEVGVNGVTAVDHATLSFLFDKLSPKTKHGGHKELYFSEIDDAAKEHPEAYSNAYERWEDRVAAESANRGFYLDSSANGSDSVMVLLGVSILTAVVAVLCMVFGFVPLPLGLVVVASCVASALALARFLSKMDRRSKEAVEIIAKLEALRNWLKDFTRLEEAVPRDVVLWNRLLIMAVVLGVADEVIKQLEVAAPEVLHDELMTPVYGWYYHHGAMGMPQEVFSSSLSHAHSVSMAEVAASTFSSSGGGGGGFSGGGGGGFGGGGGGGAF